MSKNSFKLLHPQILKVLNELGYDLPTPIQEKTIPKLLKYPQKNFLISAPTGFGKTEAVIFPLIHHIISENKVKTGIQILYITPLRSLNRDIFIRMFPLLSKKLGITIEIRHGDTSPSARSRQARKPPTILVTTPETLQSILVGSRIRQHLRNVKWVIIDEIHALVDSKRGTQLSLALERLKRLSNKFSIIGVSATIGNKEEVLNFLTCGEGGEIISLDEKKEYSIIIDAVEPQLSVSYTSGGVSWKIDILGIVRKILKWVKRTHGKVLIFTNTRDMAEILGLYLKKIAKFPLAVHHSSLSKEIRMLVEKQFKSGELKCVIATSSLELGIDIGEAELVIQVMSPRRAETALQRIGRSGHFLDRISKGVIIATTYDDVFEALAIAKLAMNAFSEPIELVEKNYDVLAHQIVGMVREKHFDGVKYATVDELYDIIKRAWPYRNLSREEFYSVLNFMDNNCRLISIKDKKVFLRRNSIKFYFHNVSTIPSTVKYKVVDVSEGYKRVGELDSKYVLELNKGDIFLLAGMPREVLEIDAKKREVLVMSVGLEGRPPVWVGELLPVSKEVANKVGELRKIFKDPRLIDDLEPYLTNDAMKILKKILTFYDKNKPVPDSRNIVVEVDQNQGIIVIHSVYGSKINKTLATGIAKLFMDNINLPYLGFESDAYRIILRLLGGVTFSSEYLFNYIEEVINMLIDISLKPEQFEKMLFESVSEFNLNELAWFFVNVMKRFGILKDENELTKKQILNLISRYKGSILVNEAIREFIQSKMDIKGTIKLLKEIDEGNIEIWFTEGITKLSLQLNSLMNVIIKDAQDIIEKKYEERLLNREVKFVCLTCGFNKIEKVANVITKCPKCGSIRISITKKWDEDTITIIRKKIKGNTINKEEIEKIKQLETLSRFLRAYGYIAAIPLAASGIGIKQAIEILRKNSGSKKSLIDAIRKREINYIKSKSIIEKKYH